MLLATAIDVAATTDMVAVIGKTMAASTRGVVGRVSHHPVRTKSQKVMASDNEE